VKKILYIGNKLENNGRTVTSIDVLGSLFEDEGYIVYYASSINNKIIRLLDMLLSCFRYRKNVDVVLIDTYSTQNFYYALLVSPYIPILHGGNLEHRLKNNLSKCKKIFNKAITNVAPSLFLKHVFNNYKFQNITYIPNPIEIKKYIFLERNQLQPKLLWVRSFSKIYNPSMAIKVVRSLNELGIECSLTMIGPDKDGSLIACQELAKQYEIPVEFTGKLSKEKWISYSKEFDVFINTTNYDNTPVSVIEAMTLGLPVVSTNVGGIPYLLENEKDALLVEKENIEQMAYAVKRLLEDANLVEGLVKNARKKVLTFDWQVVKEKWKEVLDVL